MKIQIFKYFLIGLLLTGSPFVFAKTALKDSKCKEIEQYYNSLSKQCSDYYPDQKYSVGNCLGEARTCRSVIYGESSQNLAYGQYIKPREKISGCPVQSAALKPICVIEAREKSIPLVIKDLEAQKPLIETEGGKSYLRINLKVAKGAPSVGRTSALIPEEEVKELYSSLQNWIRFESYVKLNNILGSGKSSRELKREIDNLEEEVAGFKNSLLSKKKIQNLFKSAKEKDKINKEIKIRVEKISRLKKEHSVLRLKEIGYFSGHPSSIDPRGKQYSPAILQEINRRRALESRREQLLEARKNIKKLKADGQECKVSEMNIDKIETYLFPSQKWKEEVYCRQNFCKKNKGSQTGFTLLKFNKCKRDIGSFKGKPQRSSPKEFFNSVR